MIKVAVVGATGYTGVELIRILLQHPDVEITAITSKSRPGVPYADIIPSMRGMTALTTETFDAEKIAQNADVAFTALPHGFSMPSVKALIENNIRVVDLSADFRLQDISVYNQWYGEHSCPQLLSQSVYGLPELNHKKIAKANLIANPGCYPTSAILPLYPLIAAAMIKPSSIIINSASGTSGAGKSASEAMMFCEINEDYKAYKIAQHRHTPEIEEILGHAMTSSLNITFTPHLLPVSRGILTTITADLNQSLSEEDIAKQLQTFYKDAPFVRIYEKGTYPALKNVRGSNYCDIGFKIDNRTGRLILVSAIDNLVKGAAGQAIQNMNIMFGLEEDAGLKFIPLNI